jgi:hypothetical protein
MTSQHCATPSPQTRKPLHVSSQTVTRLEMHNRWPGPLRCHPPSAPGWTQVPCYITDTPHGNSKALLYNQGTFRHHLRSRGHAHAGIRQVRHKSHHMSLTVTRQDLQAIHCTDAAAAAKVIHAATTWRLLTSATKRGKDPQHTANAHSLCATGTTPCTCWTRSHARHTQHARTARQHAQGHPPRKHADEAQPSQCPGK